MTHHGPLGTTNVSQATPVLHIIISVLQKTRMRLPLPHDDWATNQKGGGEENQIPDVAFSPSSKHLIQLAFGGWLYLGTVLAFTVKGKNSADWQSD